MAKKSKSASKDGHDLWSAVGGLDAARDKLVEGFVRPLQQQSAIARLGIRPARGFLLYGPPGVGKTLIARTAAAVAKARFLRSARPTSCRVHPVRAKNGCKQLLPMQSAAARPSSL
ncbi:MAG: AAA family ATPase [Sphingopyxis sp.]|nr:AAA family ATPase [Sphingopyxis sp.]